MICQECQTEIPGSPKFCPECGARLVAAPPLKESAGVRVCPQCGVENPSTARFCRNDGYRFPDTGAESTAPRTNPGGRDSATVPLGYGASDAAARHGTSQPSAIHALHDGEGEVTRPGASVRCPRCGTMNAAGARFCRKDGYLLQNGSEAGSASPGLKPVMDNPRSEPDSAAGGGLWRTLAIGAAVAGIVVAFAIAGVLYWQGTFGNRQSSVEASINAELGSKGLSNVRATVGKDWVATASGTVSTAAYRDQALDLLKRHPELKSVVDTIQVVADPAEVATELNKALADAGLKQLTAQVMRSDKGLLATLGGTLTSGEEPKLESVLSASPMIKEVRRNYQVAAPPPPVEDPSQQEPSAIVTTPSEIKELDTGALQQRITDHLRTAGFPDVYVSVDGDGNVTLAGTVSSHAEDNRAVQLVLAVPDVAGVDDKLRVKRPAPPPAEKTPPSTITDQPPAPPKPPRDPAKLEGDLNRALRNGGLNGITAQVGDDFSVTLNGSTTSDVDKGRAFTIAERFKGVKAVKDKIFVVED
ncbi:MAG: BON domain-containing protein [Rhodocyclaceae bacterium]